LLLYYITDRTQFPGDEVSRRRLLLDKIGEAVASGVDFIQLREKDLAAGELETLACEAVRVVQKNSRTETRLLINSRSDVAIASSADGVHLRSDDISLRDVRSLWQRSGAGRTPVIGSSCHSPADNVERARTEGADLTVFGPVFEKNNANTNQGGLGLELLSHACKIKIPVLALGGITFENARACVDAGASGIAAIRLFQENEIAEVVRRLRD
jgi:thiamine-phosphate pyrophosphorylase